MHNTRRVLTAAVAGAAMLVPAAALQAAQAAPATQTKQLVKDITGKDKRLARLATSDKITRLADENEQVLVASIAADQADLAGLKSAAEAADTTYDARAVRKELRSFRVENYVLAANIVRKAEAVATDAAAAADTEAAAAADAALDAALKLTAESTKADVKAARAPLEALEDEEEATTATTTPTA